MKNLFKVEFHCHTRYSPDSRIDPVKLVRTARNRGLDRLVVTDHNTIRGALAAKKIDPDLVITGEEILTRKGELLAIYVQEEVPPYLTPKEAIWRLKQQGAFISVSHPFDWKRKGWSPADLVEILPSVDAIEIFNSRSFSMGVNAQARNFAEEHGIPGLAGSDAHLLREVGRSTMLLPPFNNPEELRAAIRSGVQYQTRLSPIGVHIGSTCARILNLISKKKGFDP